MNSYQHSFTISRSTWIRGKDPLDRSQLLSYRTGRMCCLGFYLKSCGVLESTLVNMRIPSHIASSLPPDAQWLIRNNCSKKCSQAANTLIEVNDEEGITGHEREAKIKHIFAEHNIEVKFVP